MQRRPGLPHTLECLGMGRAVWGFVAGSSVLILVALTGGDVNSVLSVDIAVNFYVVVDAPVYYGMNLSLDVI